MPRDEAVMPYWVPQVLRSHKKVRGRLAWQRGLRVRGGLRREPEVRERVLGSFPTVVSVDVWGPSGSRGLGQQNAGGKWYSGQAQARCPGGVGKGGVHCFLMRAPTAAVTFPAMSSVPFSSSAFSSLFPLLLHLPHLPPSSFPPLLPPLASSPPQLSPPV